MATLCSISGELPQRPVVSTKSGNVYEKRLVEAYITENGTEPTTGAPLTTEDLLDIQASHTVRPRPPEFTSIPALLGTFQQEWDALALEVFTLQQNLAQTRQELSTALYQHDAAVRVIARLTKERDDAREALRNIQVSAPVMNGTNGDAMHVDSRSLPDSIKAKIQSTQEGLMKTRRKRPVPAEWATSDTLSLFKPTKTIKTSCVDASFLSVNKSSNSAVTGSVSNGAYIISSTDGSVATVVADEPVTAGVWTSSGIAVGTSRGKVALYENGQRVASLGSHASDVTGLAVHASGEILASCSSDKTYALYDLEQKQDLTQVQTSSELKCLAFHPDGHLLAVGGQNGQIQIFDVNTSQVGGIFELGAPAKAICFSENGTWLASATEGATTISIWDLRKAGTDQGLIHTLEVGHDITSLDWDYTAQYLLVGGSTGITVKQYAKSTKLWSEPLKVSVSGVGVGWGDSAQSIVSIGAEGTATVLSSE